jgi:hypothetical protein
VSRSPVSNVAIAMVTSGISRSLYDYRGAYWPSVHSGEAVKTIFRGFLVALAIWTVLVGLWWFQNVRGVDEGGETGLGAAITLGVWVFGVMVGLPATAVLAVTLAVARLVSRNKEVAPEGGSDQTPLP